jgi:NCS2 family nucleobase:cation symporter-2
MALRVITEVDPPSATEIHPVDEAPAPAKLALFGLQHVLIMYAGAVAVPLIVGRALKLAPEQVTLLISADLFACGLATLIQTLGLPGVGVRLPVMMGVTFASVSPMLAMAAGVGGGGGALSLIYGSVIAAGVFGLLAAPFVGRLSRLFPPVVTGTVILVIGVSLMRIGIGWAAGAQPSDPSYGAPMHLGVALFVLAVILAVTRFGKGLISHSAVLIGIVAGCLLCLAMGEMSFARVAVAKWFAPVLPFQFGMPTFSLIPALTMCLVMVVVMIESFGMFLAVGDMVNRPLTEKDVTRGMRGDAVGTILGGLFNTFPYTSFSQNVGLVAVTGVRSRFVCAAGGVILLLLGLSPKLAAVVEAVPTFVLGGAGIVMFGMIAATGVRILAKVDFTNNRNNLIIVGASLTIGMIPLVSEKFFQFFPAALSPLLGSSVLLATISAVLLNAYYNGARTPAAA